MIYLTFNRFTINSNLIRLSFSVKSFPWPLCLPYEKQNLGILEKFFFPRLFFNSPEVFSGLPACHVFLS